MAYGKRRFVSYAPVASGAAQRTVDDSQRQAPSFTGSPQQVAIWDALVTGDAHVIVKALAGTGKTSTILAALYRLRPGLNVAFVAFNKSIATELQSKVPLGVTACTLHSLGFKAIQAAFGRVQVNSVQYGKTIDMLPSLMEQSAKNTIGRMVSLCKGSLIDGTDRVALLNLAADYDVDLGDNPDEILRWIPDVLKRSRDNVRVIDFDDMVWLPVVLALPLRKFDVLFVDESQDLNAAQQSLVMLAGDRICLVGDENQCQPAGTQVVRAIPGKHGNRWAGPTLWETVPIESISAGDKLVSLDIEQSHLRRSGSLVKQIASRPYSGSLVAVETPDGLRSRYTPNHRCVVLFGTTLMEQHAVYLMRRGNDYRIGLTGARHVQQQNRLGVTIRATQEKADAVWILSLHNNRAAAVSAELDASATFGIPGLTFRAGNNSVLSQNQIDNFWQKHGHNAERAERALVDHGRDIALPIWERGQRNLRARQPTIMHACNLLDGMEVLPLIGAMASKRARSARQWSPISISRETYSGTVYSLDVEHDQTYVADGIVTHNCIYGFRGADYESLQTMAERLSATPRGLLTFPLTLTRRCAPAIVDAARQDVETFETTPELWAEWLAYKAEMTAAIADGRAYPVAFDHLGRVCTGGTDKLPCDAHPDRADMVLCRTNAPLIASAYHLIRQNIPVKIQGRDIGAGLASMIKKLVPADASTVTLLEKLHAYRVKEEAKIHAANGNGRADAKLQALGDRCDCIEALTEGMDTVSEVLNRVDVLFSDVQKGNASAFVLLSSIHRAKGLEAHTVHVIHPELLPHPMARTPKQIKQEFNLRYVARTRAIRELHYH